MASYTGLQFFREHGVYKLFRHGGSKHRTHKRTKKRKKETQLIIS